MDHTWCQVQNLFQEVNAYCDTADAHVFDVHIHKNIPINISQEKVMMTQYNSLFRTGL